MSVTRRTVLAGLALPGLPAAAKPGGLVAFAAQDGVPVTGRIYGAGRRGVVLIPGGHGVGETWHIQARGLARAGFHVLAMDYRGRGRASVVAPDDEQAHRDVIGAARHLRARGARSVALVGASWGGWAAGTATIAVPDLAERIVLLAHSPLDQPERLGGRKLFILAREDRVGSGKLRLDEVRQQYERARAPKQLVLLDGAAHAQFLFLTDQGPRLTQEIFRFLQTA
jgi:pimeloyl-ACP methyl ester carboxylesterase